MLIGGCHGFTFSNKSAFFDSPKVDTKSISTSGVIDAVQLNTFEMRDAILSNNFTDCAEQSIYATTSKHFDRTVGIMSDEPSLSITESAISIRSTYFWRLCQIQTHLVTINIQNHNHFNYLLTRNSSRKRIMQRCNFSNPLNVHNQVHSVCTTFTKPLLSQFPIWKNSFVASQIDSKLKISRIVALAADGESIKQLSIRLHSFEQ